MNDDERTRNEANFGFRLALFLGFIAGGLMPAVARWWFCLGLGLLIVALTIIDIRREVRA